MRKERGEDPPATSVSPEALSAQIRAILAAPDIEPGPMKVAHIWVQTDGANEGSGRTRAGALSVRRSKRR